MKASDSTPTAPLALGSEPLLGRGGACGDWGTLSPGRKLEGDPRGFWEQEFQTCGHEERGVGASQLDVEKGWGEAEITQALRGGQLCPWLAKGLQEYICSKALLSQMRKFREGRRHTSGGLDGCGNRAKSPTAIQTVLPRQISEGLLSSDHPSCPKCLL